MSPWPRVRRRRLSTRVAIAAGIGLGTIVLVEASLRVVLTRGAPTWSFGPPGLEFELRTDPSVMPGVTGGARTVLDVRGLRAHGRPDAALRVVCVGGSTTECAALDQEETWPALLQTEWGDDAWVAAAAASGLTSRAHVLQVGVLVEERPSRVLCLVGVNDLALALERGESFDARGLDHSPIRASVERRAFFAPPLEPRWWPPARTTIGTLLSRARRARWARASAARDLPERLVLWRGLRAEQSALLVEPPDLAPALDEYRGNLAAMAGAARDHGVELVLLTQPTIWTDPPTPAAEDLCWFGWVGRAPAVGRPDAYHATATLARGMARYNDALRAVCDAEGVRCIDLAASMDGDPRWFYDDCHFNEAGARRVAELVVAGLR